jgi:hypothetical protein
MSWSSASGGSNVKSIARVVVTRFCMLSKFVAHSALLRGEVTLICIRLFPIRFACGIYFTVENRQRDVFALIQRILIYSMVKQKILKSVQQPA